LKQVVELITAGKYLHIKVGGKVDELDFNEA